MGGARLTQLIQAANSCQQVLQLVQQAGQQCNAFHFSKAVNRVAKLQQQRPSASNQAAFAALLSFAEQHPAALNHVAVAQTVYAGGVLQHRLTAEQQAAWQDRLVWAFARPKLEPQHVSNSLWGWSRMGLPLQGQLAAAADSAMALQAASMTSQNVSNTLLAFANAGWPLGSRAAAAMLLQLEQVLPQAKPQHVANSLWAMSKLGLHLSGSLAAAAEAAILCTAGHMVPQAVSNTLLAFANASWPLDSRAAAALVQQLEQVLPQAKPQEVANSLWAAAKLGLQPSGSLLAAAVAAMQRLVASGAVKPQELSNFLWGLAELRQLGTALRNELPALFVAAADWADSRWAHLPALDVADLCYNLARLGTGPAGPGSAAPLSGACANMLRTAHCSPCICGM